MHRKLFFLFFLLLGLPYLNWAQADEFIELSFDSPIGNVTWSPTGSKIAFTTGKTLQIYDRIGESLQTVHLRDNDESIHIDHLVWSEREQYLAVLSQSDQSVGLSASIDLHIYLVEDGSLFLDFPEALRDGQYIFGSISHVDFSNDDQRMSVLSGQYVGGQAYESNVYLIDLKTKETQSLLRAVWMGTWIGSTAWSPSGNILAVDFGSFIELWNTTTLEQVNSIRTGRAVTEALHWKDEHTLITTGPKVQTWDTQTGELLSSLPLITTDVQSGASTVYDPVTDRIQICYREPENRIEIFDGDTGQMTHRQAIDDLDNVDEEYTYVFNAAGTAYARINGGDISITSIDLPAVTLSVPQFTMQYLETAPASDDLPLNVHWRADNTLVAQSEHGVMHLAEAQPRWRTVKPVDDVQLIDSAYSPSGRYQAVGTYDADSRFMSIQLWDLLGQKQLIKEEGYLGREVRFAFSTDERLLAAASADMFIRVWDTQTGELQQELYGLGQLEFLSGFSPYTAMVFSPNNRYLGAVGDGLAHVWDMENGDHRSYSAFTEYVIPPYATTHIIFGANSTSFTFRTIKFEGLYSEPPTDEYDYPISATFNDVLDQDPAYLGKGDFDVQISNDGAVFATTDRLGNVELIDASSREPIPLPTSWCAESHPQLYPIESRSADWMSFSPDSSLFAFVVNELCIPEVLWDMQTDLEEVAQRNTIWIVDAKTGELQLVIEDINATIHTIAFSPDGTILLAKLDGQPFALWETATFKRIEAK